MKSINKQKNASFWSNYISRPHPTDFPQKVAFWKGHPLISGKSRLVKKYNLARSFPSQSLKGFVFFDPFFLTGP